MVLPIESILDSLKAQLLQHQRLVIQAPPGAGKTTLIPIALLPQCPAQGKILLIQPRRLAVYSAARQLAANLNQALGETVGYRTRYDKKVSQQTQIEVITDGLFLNQIQHDPELKDVSLVLFDEFHERSTAMDLGLAFALETQAALRDEESPLRILVMSATLNGEQLSQWLDAPLLVSKGRSFDVQIHYHPVSNNQYMEQAIAQLVIQCLVSEPGNVLVFLPGIKQIRQLQQRLEQAELHPSVQVLPLHATLPANEQEQAILPCEPGWRKVVLATNVAETSITIDDVRVVIDSGLERVSRYDERRGFNQLRTEVISQASAQQRSGRAGRTQAGICFRMWGESKQQTLAEYASPEILTDDLAPVVLQLARWGLTDPSQLKLLDQPPQDAFKRAQTLLVELEALQQNLTISDFGTDISSLPLPPRLAALVWRSLGQDYFSDCCFIAAILSESDPLQLPGDQFQSEVDLRLSLQRHKDRYAIANRLKRVNQVSRQLQQRVTAIGSKTPVKPIDSGLAEALCLAFPDRVAQQRQANGQRYLMANGKGVKLMPADNLSRHRLLVVLDCDGDPKEPYIKLACPIELAQVRLSLAQQIRQDTQLIWDQDKQQVQASQVETIGQLALHQQPIAKPWPLAIQQQAQQKLLEAIVADQLRPLPWTPTSDQLLDRINWLYQQNSDQWPDVSPTALMATAKEWLTPYLINWSNYNELASLDLPSVLMSMLSWEQQQLLDQLAPAYWTLATGRQQRIDYGEQGGPVVSAPMQAFYGVNQHPTLPSGFPIRLQLLSPAKRPLQITQDLPRFWQGSYESIAKEMRGRYPKHHWPQQPALAQATEKPKARTKGSAS